MNEVTIKLNYLKRTNGHKFTECEFRVLIAVFNHTNKYGCRSHPGIEMLEAETGYKHSAISKALKSLCDRGWIHQTYRGNGKAELASSYDLVADAPNPDYRCEQCWMCRKTSTQVDVLDKQDEVKTSTQVDVLETKISTSTPKTSTSVSNTSISVLNTSTPVDAYKSYITSPIDQVLYNKEDSEPLKAVPTTEDKRGTVETVPGAATNVAAKDDPFGVDQGQNPDPFDDVPFDVPTETPTGVEGELNDLIQAILKADCYYIRLKGAYEVMGVEPPDAGVIVTAAVNDGTLVKVSLPGTGMDVLTVPEWEWRFTDEDDKETA